MFIDPGVEIFWCVNVRSAAAGRDFREGGPSWKIRFFHSAQIYFYRLPLNVICTKVDFCELDQTAGSKHATDVVYQTRVVLYLARAREKGLLDKVTRCRQKVDRFTPEKIRLAWITLKSP
jgi:hypothetical protein